MDATDAVLHVLRKFALEDCIELNVVGECAELMELSEESVELVGSIVEDELVPVA